MRHPRHLWTGAWQEESERSRRALDDQPAEPTLDHDRPAPESHEPPPPPPRRNGRGRVAAAVAVPAVALAAGGYWLGTRNDNDQPASRAAATPLPAATSSTPVRPRAGQTRTGSIYAKASPGVVSIRAGSGSGTGFLVKDTQTVVTNAHVVESQDRVVVRFGTHGRQIQAQVMGTDPSSDLAVVRLPSGSAPSGAKPLALADSNQVGIGDQVVAIGNPFGLDRTATEGIVSGLGREIRAPNGFSIDDAIQTDAAINPGNSGGPLLDDGGRVIGVNSQIETGGGSNGNVGIGFAVPSNTVREVVPELQAGRQVEHAYLGVESGPSPTGSGAMISRVTSGGPAQRAGLQPGDELLSINGQPIADVSDISRIINDAAPGDRVNLRVRRGSQEHNVTVTLGDRPAQVP